MRLSSWLAPLLVLFALIVASVSAPLAANAAPPAAPQPVSARTIDPVADYRLGSGDKIRVTVFGEEQLSGEFFVGASGKVALPLLGEIQAGGLTLREFQAEVETALKDGYLKEPRVSAEVLNYRPFYILGEVNKPGTYPYTSGLTVVNAVATAEGFTYRANTKRVFIKRANDVGEKEYPLTTTTMVAPGDTIRIAERFF